MNKKNLMQGGAFTHLLKFLLSALISLMLISSFSACSNDDDEDNPPKSTSSGPTASEIKQNINGKWIMTSLDGAALTTNAKSVYTFSSRNRAFLSSAIFNEDLNLTYWNAQTEYKVEISGSKVTLSNADDQTTIIFDITDITSEQITTPLSSK